MQAVFFYYFFIHFLQHRLEALGAAEFGKRGIAGNGQIIDALMKTPSGIQREE
jgi:hypothetical protein